MDGPDLSSQSAIYPPARPTLPPPFNREQMVSTTTIPFDLPAPGVKIAVKVIDQTGMEHMTVVDDPRATLQK